MKRILTVLLATLIMLGCASCMNRNQYPDVNYGTGTVDYYGNGTTDYYGNGTVDYYGNNNYGNGYNTHTTVPGGIAPL